MRAATTDAERRARDGFGGEERGATPATAAAAIATPSGPGPEETRWTARRERLRAYFDESAAESWRRLTGDGPLSRVRRSVRAGRETMRRTLLGWLPDDLAGARLLDAGCGTGAFAAEAARRGARVVAVDIAPRLVATARERLDPKLADRVEFRVGDLLALEDTGSFDHVVAMDSLIHYPLPEMVRAIGALGERLDGADARLLVTFAPATPALAALHRVGKLFPRGDRSPAIEPVAETRLRAALARGRATAGLEVLATRHVASGFYRSRAMALAPRTAPLRPEAAAP